jgi:glucose/arabinose dehydrogenase
MTVEMEIFVDGLNFPTSLAFGPDGSVYVAESGLPFAGAPPGGVVWRVRADGGRERVFEDLRAPVNGLLWHDDGLIISEGGHPGRIVHANPDTGERRTLIDGLPGFGNYHTNMVALGPDGKLYFSQGAMTNSAIMGPDSVDLAWLRELQHNADIPGYDIAVGEASGMCPGPDGVPVRTGAFAPFGAVHPPGTRLTGRTPCTAAVMRCNPDGSALELVAWGLRNAYGLGFLPDGRLIATDQGADVRGLRPIWNCPDFLYEVKAGAWYGWPDYYGGLPIDHARYRAPDGTAQPYALRDHASLPPPEPALVEFALNACAVKFAVIPPGQPHAGDLLVAQFGDERPMTGPAGPQVARDLVRVAVDGWTLHPVAASGPKRPLDVAFSPDGAWVYVVDFGAFEFVDDAATGRKRIEARAGSGRIWRLPADSLEHTTMTTRISFERDIAPMFAQYRASMLWRLDLARYDDMKLNAPMVYSQISSDDGPPSMPPPPYPPMTDAQVALFKAWMDQAFPL